jgi:hypothetical protein
MSEELQIAPEKQGVFKRILIALMAAKRAERIGLKIVRCSYFRNPIQIT